HRTVDSSGGRQYLIELLQGLVQVNRQRLCQSEWTDTADRVSGPFGNLSRREHLALAEGLLELSVIDASVTARHQDDHPAIAQAERQGLGDATGLNPMCLGGRRNRRRVHLQLDDGEVQPTAQKKITYGLQAHWRYRLEGEPSAIEVLARRRQAGWPEGALRCQRLKNPDAVQGEAARDAGQIGEP